MIGRNFEIESRKSKGRQYSDQKKEDIKYKNTQNTSQKTQDSTTRTPLKSGVDLDALKRYYRNVTQKLPS